MPQLAPKDLVAIDGLARQKKLGPMDIARRVNQARKKRGMDEVDKSTIYRYLKGSLHRRGMVEKRGRKQSLTGGRWTWAGTPWRVALVCMSGFRIGSRTALARLAPRPAVVFGGIRHWPGTTSWAWRPRGSPPGKLACGQPRVIVQETVVDAT